jgi:hypothetical protein
VHSEDTFRVSFRFLVPRSTFHVPRQYECGFEYIRRLCFLTSNSTFPCEKIETSNAARARSA